MPQLETKVPALRRYLAKTAIAIDFAHFIQLGGPTSEEDIRTDPRDGDVLWLVTDLRMDGGAYRLVRRHYEVLNLERTMEKLLNAAPITAQNVLSTIRDKLQPYQP